MVDVAFVEAFNEVLSLEEIRATPELGEMALVKRARLSVQPVAKEAFQLIRRMGRKK
jgi:predicted RNA-binding protein with PUA-like domain